MRSVPQWSRELYHETIYVHFLVCYYISLFWPEIDFVLTVQMQPKSSSVSGLSHPKHIATTVDDPQRVVDGPTGRITDNGK